MNGHQVVGEEGEGVAGGVDARVDHVDRHHVRQGGIRAVTAKVELFTF
jgi:hypothetical protein